MRDNHHIIRRAGTTVFSHGAKRSLLVQVHRPSDNERIEMVNRTTRRSNDAHGRTALFVICGCALTIVNSSADLAIGYVNTPECAKNASKAVCFKAVFKRYDNYLSFDHVFLFYMIGVVALFIYRSFKIRIIIALPITVYAISALEELGESHFYYRSTNSMGAEILSVPIFYTVLLVHAAMLTMWLFKGLSMLRRM